MTRAVVLALLLAPWLRGQGKGEENVFLEVEVARTTCWVGEVVPLRLRIGYDAAFLASSAIQPFQVRLDLPVQVQVPWLQKPPLGLRLLPAVPASGSTRSFVLNEGQGAGAPAGERMVSGRKFTLVEVERRGVVETAGELVLPAPVLQFAYATRFEETFLNGRVPADRQEATVNGKELRLQVQPLPVQGRPPEFCGGVGTFRIAASVDRRELAVGETVRLQVRIEGEGNLAACTPPVLAWDGFVVHGPLDDTAAGKRTWTWDLVPRAVVREVPAIRLACFDPHGEAGYRTLTTAPVQLSVRPGSGTDVPAGTNESARIPGVDDIHDLKPVPSPSGSSRQVGPVLVIASLLLPWALAFVLLRWVRGRERDRNDPLGVAARVAHAAFTASMASPATEAAGAFTTYVAARLRCPPAAVVGPQLAARLQAAGIPSPLAADVVALVRELGAQRFGGSAVAEARKRALSLAQALEVAFAQEQGT